MSNQLRQCAPAAIVIRDNKPRTALHRSKKRLKNPRKKNPGGNTNAGMNKMLLPARPPALPPLTLTTVLITVAANLQRLPTTFCAILRGTPTLHSQNIHTCRQIK
jgi:hypothetical protein